MSLSRRTFLVTSGCALAAMTGRANAVSQPSNLSVTDGRLARHVLDRVAYGPRPGDVARVQAMGIDVYLEEQLRPERLDDGACIRRTRRLETLQCPTGELFEYKEHVLWKELATGKLLRACYSERQLFEVMVDFWSDHFNIDSSKGDCPWLKTADDRDVIRKHALGTFPELLRASALGPAMLWYLDGRMNRRRNPEEAPNENYARELLELHTLGVHGGYTQQDVMEVARCLTGWTVRTDTWFGKGRVEFKSGLHDDGAKRVLGHDIPAGQGRGDVDTVLDIVAKHPGTARYLATKLCHRFIGEDTPEAVVSTVAQKITNSGGDIRVTLRHIFQTEAFRAPDSMKFKRPFRFIVAALRGTDADIKRPGTLLDYLARMGHSPFQYPTPDGYPEEAGPWMGTMLWRWHFVHAMAKDGLPGVSTDWAALKEQAGGGMALTAALLGEQPSAAELQLAQAGDAPGLVMAAPRYQGA
ncbi:MAG: DUF1800 domain-containing protein [Candidatus Hydrogenedentes bacterium]|nr:DUF1800 domain-containing protein [Candidatus Hydrogenedentota bacterium]